MRFSLILLLTLAACQPAEIPEATAQSDGQIDCRIGADDQFVRSCTIERTQTDRGRVLTVLKPDGGFRRLLVATDGRGVIAADGAERAEVTIIGPDRIQVGIGGDSFRLPARIAPVADGQAASGNVATNSQ